MNKTLLVLGKFDNPIGNPEKNSKFAEKHISNVKIEIVDAGHLMSMEKPELMRVRPGAPDSSYLVMKITGLSISG